MYSQLKVMVSSRFVIPTIRLKIKIRKIVSCEPSRRTNVVLTVGSFWKIMIYRANLRLSQMRTGITIITISSREISLKI